MGLDQYAHYTPPEGGDPIEFAYWRKHNRLQGWMEQLWREKTGSKEQFNCVEVELTKEDLVNFREAITNKELPETSGFFFGDDSYEYYEEFNMERDVKFLNEAMTHVMLDRKVTYSSWW